jgi:hypothetical protein
MLQYLNRSPMGELDETPLAFFPEGASLEFSAESNDLGKSR